MNVKIVLRNELIYILTEMEIENKIKRYLTQGSFCSFIISKNGDR